MAVRPPGAQKNARYDPLAAAFDYEAAGEAATSLGLAGKKVEDTLAALRKCASGEPEHGERIADAATAVYHYFIQREIMGMRRHEGAIREYAIPAEVLARLGAVKRNNTR